MNYSDFLLPCLLLAVLQQIILVAVCTNLASEKAKLNIYKKTGLNFSSIFFGKTIPYILIGSIINFFNIFIILPINSIYAVSLFGVFTVSTAFIIAMVFFQYLYRLYSDLRKWLWQRLCFILYQQFYCRVLLGHITLCPYF